jgi:enoyl-CoA hydratase/carnithine racemase
MEVLDTDPNIKVIIIASRLPKIFCAGADIKEL